MPTFQKASAYLNTATNVTAGNFIEVPIDTVIYDPSGIVSTANHRITPTVAGYYLCTGLVAAGSVNSLLACLTKNGVVTPLYAYGTEAAAITGGSISTVTSLISLNGSTDFVQLGCQNQGAGTAALAIATQFNLLTVLGPF